MPVLSALRRSWWGLMVARYDTEPTELMGALLKIVLGAWLLLPFDTFSSSPSFVDLSVVPEPIWGAALLVFGVTHLLALRSGCPRRRRHGALLGFLVWFTMSITFLLANPPAMGWLVFMSPACGQAWAYIRLRGEV